MKVTEDFHKNASDKYLYFDSRWLNEFILVLFLFLCIIDLNPQSSHMIKINNRVKELIALICVNILNDIYKTLCTKIQFIYLMVPKFVDTTKEGFGSSFTSALREALGPVLSWIAKLVSDYLVISAFLMFVARSINFFLILLTSFNTLSMFYQILTHFWSTISLALCFT
jgi:hypothetical protein